MLKAIIMSYSWAVYALFSPATQPHCPPNLVAFQNFFALTVSLFICSLVSEVGPKVTLESQ